MDLSSFNLDRDLWFEAQDLADEMGISISDFLNKAFDAETARIKAGMTPPAVGPAIEGQEPVIDPSAVAHQAVRHAIDSIRAGQGFEGAIG
jgi:hypothetical protein